MSSKHRIVYSTDPNVDTSAQPSPASPPSGDGIVRLHRETKGRKGKGVTIVVGLGLQLPELKKLCRELKKQCGCGGTVKDFTLELQTDNRDKIKICLEKRQFKVKCVGG
ncbi:MAG: stress response translation initiation inhibitor YciH [Shewanellaceae bacterium]|nr:stress response translation initiation inhibitor YciH [Shewanellaceae bacterium]